MKRKWTVTAYEIVPRVREYTAETREEAVKKMTKWCRNREYEGSEFSGTMRVRHSEESE